MGVGGVTFHHLWVIGMDVLLTQVSKHQNMSKIDTTHTTSRTCENPFRNLHLQLNLNFPYV